MAITLDIATTYLNGSAINPHTWSHTCSGSDRALFVAVGTNNATISVNSMTYSGVAMSLVGRQANNFGGAQCMTELWKLSNPASGTNTVSVTLNTTSGLWGASISFNGANQTTSSLTGATTGTNTQADTPTLSPESNVGDLVLDAFFHETDTSTDSVPNAGQTQQFNKDSGGAFPNELAGSTKDGTATSTSMGWNMAGSNFAMTYIAVAIKAASAAPISSNVEKRNITQVRSIDSMARIN